MAPNKVTPADSVTAATEFFVEGTEHMRYGKFSSHLSKNSFVRISTEFGLGYIVVGIAFGIVYWALCLLLPEEYFSFQQGRLCFPQALYFSFITQLTVGYGDFTPVAYAQPLAVGQAIIGVVLAGVWAGVVVTKWLAYGDRRSILFAEWAGYSLAEQKFFLLFVNRNVEDLVDVNVNAIIKLSSYNPVVPGVNPPYIGKSAWTFSLQRVPVSELAELRFFPGDGIKVSISGTAGMTRCTNFRKYTLDQVFVLQSRDHYWNDIFENPKFDEQFFEHFRHPVQEAVPFLQFDFQAEAGRR